MHLHVPRGRGPARAPALHESCTDDMALLVAVVRCLGHDIINTFGIFGSLLPVSSSPTDVLRMHPSSTILRQWFNPRSSSISVINQNRLGLIKILRRSRARLPKPEPTSPKCPRRCRNPHIRRPSPGPQTRSVLLIGSPIQSTGAGSPLKLVVVAAKQPPPWSAVGKSALEQDGWTQGLGHSSSSPPWPAARSSNTTVMQSPPEYKTT